MKRTLFIMLSCFLILSSIGFGQMKNKKLGAQQFKGTVSINAKPAAVWALIVDGKKFFSLAGWELITSDAKFAKVGDNARIKVWGDAGTISITYYKANKELRYSWDPDNASYICQERIILEAKGDKTTLTYINTYSESGPQSKSDIDAQIKSLNQLLSKIKKSVEG